MSMNVDNKTPGFNPAEIGLVAPKEVGKQYMDPVTRPLGAPLGEGDDGSPQGLKGSPKAQEVFKDTLESVSSTDASLSPEVLGFNLAIGLQGFQVLAQQQIDNLDPASPAIVLLPRLAQVYQNMLLNAGDLVGAQGAFGASKLVIEHKISQGETASDISGLKTDGKSEITGAPATNEDIKVNTSGLKANGKDVDIGAPPTNEEVTNAFAAAVAETPGTGKIAWMAGTSYTAFLVNYWEMMSILKEMKALDGKIQIEGMNMMVQLAKDTADAIMDAAETRFWEHIAMAIVDGVSAGVTVAMTAASVGFTMKMKAEMDTDVKQKGGTTKTVTADEIKVSNIKWQAMAAGAGGLGQATGSAEKAIDNVIQGAMELEASKYDAIKEVLQAFRQVMQMQADRAQDSFNKNSDLIKELLNQLDQMGAKIQEAQAKALSRS